MAVWDSRTVGASVVLIVVQVSVAGVYRPPVLVDVVLATFPPHTIISLPVHTAV